MDKFAMKVLDVVSTGLAMVLKCIFLLFSICGMSMIIYPYIETGVKYSIEQFIRFFSDNATNPVANSFGVIFNKFVETTKPYPWVYVAIIILGILIAIRGVNLGKHFIKKIDELFETARIPTSTNLKAKTFPAGNRAAIASSRKIGFGDPKMISQNKPHNYGG